MFHGLVALTAIIFTIIFQANSIWHCKSEGQQNEIQYIIKDVDISPPEPRHMNKSVLQTKEARCPMNQFLHEIRKRGKPVCGGATNLSEDPQWPWDSNAKCRGPFVGYTLAQNGEGKGIRLERTCSQGEYVTIYIDKTEMVRNQEQMRCKFGQALCSWSYIEGNKTSRKYTSFQCCQLPADYIKQEAQRPRVTENMGKTYEQIGPNTISSSSKIFLQVPDCGKNRYPTSIAGTYSAGDKILRNLTLQCGTDTASDCAWTIVGFAFRYLGNYNVPIGLNSLAFECESGDRRMVPPEAFWDLGPDRQYKCSPGSAVCGITGYDEGFDILCCPVVGEPKPCSKAKSFFEKVLGDRITVGLDQIHPSILQEYDSHMFNLRSTDYTKAVVGLIEDSVRTYYPGELGDQNFHPRVVTLNPSISTAYQLVSKCGSYIFRFRKILVAHNMSCENLESIGVYDCSCQAQASFERPSCRASLLWVPYAEFWRNGELYLNGKINTHLQTKYIHAGKQAKAREVGLVQVPVALRNWLLAWDSWEKYNETNGILQWAEQFLCTNGLPSIRQAQFYRSSRRDIFGPTNGEYVCLRQLQLICGEITLNTNIFDKNLTEGQYTCETNYLGSSKH